MEDRHPTRGEGWSAGVFGLAVAIALPMLLWFGRDYWFFLDDWWVLPRDGLTSPGYLDGHNGHWITVVRFVHRLNFELWGLRTYLPYQVPVVVAHLGAALLLRQVIRRLGVRGWIATVTALAFLFFGTGRENLLWGHQIGQTGSVVCGLALFLLTDSSRSVTRRDWLALGLGLLGLMTSGMFLGYLAGFAVTTLLRRGLPVAAFYTLPLGLIFASWHVLYGRDNATPLDLTVQAARFVGGMFWATFDALAQGGVGAVLVGAGGLGVVSALHRARRSGVWADAALPIGLAVGWAVFAVSTALSRAGTLPDIYSSGRYLYVGAALLLPLVAVGADRLARHRLLLGAAALVPLAVGFPGNLDRLSDTPGFHRGNPELVLAMAHSPFIDDVPPDTLQGAVGDLQPPLTTGWLAQQAVAGRIPEPDGVDPVRDLTATSLLVLAHEDGSRDAGACSQLTRPTALHLQSGDTVEFTGTVVVTVTDGTHDSAPREFLSSRGSAIRALAGPVNVVLRPAPSEEALTCTSVNSET